MFEQLKKVPLAVWLIIAIVLLISLFFNWF